MDASPTRPDDTAFGTLCTIILEARLATRPSPPDGRSSAAPSRRTVRSALRAMGLDHEKRFHRYHRVLNRASWSSRKVSRALLGLRAGLKVWGARSARTVHRGRGRARGPTS